MTEIIEEKIYSYCEKVRNSLITTLTFYIKNRKKGIEVYNKLSETKIKIADIHKNKKTLGTANHHDNVITLYIGSNLKYATNKELEEVIIHEFMHIIVETYYKQRCSHNQKYKNMCKLFGYDENVYNKTRVISNATYNEKRYKVYCTKCGKVIHGFDRLTEKMKVILMISTSGCCKAEIVLRDKRG
ncbi:MAG: SprT-like domain-containing protein [Peptostreptococcaceae bacterium]